MTAGVRIRILDQFLTRPELAEAYVQEVAKRWSDPDVLFVWNHPRAPELS